MTYKRKFAEYLENNKINFDKLSKKQKEKVVAEFLLVTTNSTTKMLEFIKEVIKW